jgi:fructokinase
LSGPGLEREYAFARGEQLKVPDIVQLELAGDPVAAQCLDRYIDRMARALASVINIIDPQVIVLGGGMGNIQRLYRDVPGVWGQYIFSDRVDTRLARPMHGDSSGVRGAAWLWPVDNKAG